MSTKCARLRMPSQWPLLAICLLGVNCQKVVPHPEAHRDVKSQREPSSATNSLSPSSAAGDNGAVREKGERSVEAQSAAGPTIRTDSSKRLTDRSGASKTPAVPTTSDGGLAVPGVLVKRLKIASGVVDREPVLAERMRTAEDVYAFLEVANPRNDANEVRVVFEHENGRRVGFVDLSVPAKTQRWRTWAQTAQVTSAGNWSAIVSSADGVELGRADFVVE